MKKRSSAHGSRLSPVKKLGQAAMEFLFTYGWAILVVLILIGALMHFGVLSPETFQPDTCKIETGFSCPDFYLKGDRIAIQLNNAFDKDMTIYGINFTSKVIEGYCDNATEITVASGQTANLLASCSLGTHVGEKKRFDFLFVYQFSGNSDADLRHSAEGNIVGIIS